MGGLFGLRIYSTRVIFFFFFNTVLPIIANKDFTSFEVENIDVEGQF